MIPFIDLQAQQDRIKPQVDAAIQRVLNHGKYIMGPEVAELENQLADFVGAKHCIGVSNGTDALSMSLMAYDVGPGDAVITTPFTFFATVEAIMLRGATPIFADIDPQTFNICPVEIRNAIERTRSKTDLNLRGIIPVDLYGLPADYQSIMPIANEHDLFVLQDSAQSFGALRAGKYAPSHGHIGTASFFPAKPLGCYGDGGAVITDDDELAEKVRSIRVHGKGIDKYDNVRLGLNARLDTIQAAILIEKLKIYPDELELRQKVAAQYTKAIANINAELGDGVIGRQIVPEGSQSAWAQFVIQSPGRDKIAEELKSAGIPTVVYYRTPAHLLKACENLPAAISLPNSELAASQILALPFHPYLLDDSLQQVISIIRKAHRFEPKGVDKYRPCNDVNCTRRQPQMKEDSENS